MNHPTQRLLWPVVVLASGILVLIMMVGNIQSPIRPWIAFWFLLICPGYAFIPLLRLHSGWIQLPVGLALSIAIDTIVAETLVLARLWSPLGALIIICGIAFAGIALQSFRIIQPEIARRREA